MAPMQQAANNSRSPLHGTPNASVSGAASTNLDMSCPQEVSILKSLNYDRNITQFYGACIRPGQDLMLVTEVRTSVYICHASPTGL